MRTQNNYFTMPNEVFQLGLSAGELAVYSYLRRCEDRRTHQCWPSYRTIGSAVGMGNIWRFPYLVSAWGGMTFLLPYFLFVILIGSTGVIGEFALGRAAGAGLC